MFTRIKTIAEKLRVPTEEELALDYLNNATDRYDIEFRSRQIDQGLFKRRQQQWL